MNEIRYYYYKQIKKLKAEAEMKSENIPLNSEQDYLKYIAEQNKAMPKSERSTIKEDASLMDMEYHKVLVSDLNAVLDSAIYYVNLHGSESYDGDALIELQESIKNIQDYKDILTSQYIK